MDYLYAPRELPFHNYCAHIAMATGVATHYIGHE